MRRVRGYADNRTAPLAAEHRQGMTEHIERPAGIDRHTGQPVCGAGLICQPHPQNARTVHQHVQRWLCCQQTPAQAVYRIAIGDIQHFGAERVFRFVETQVEANYLGTGPNKRQRRLQANTGTRAGNPNPLTGKIALFTHQDFSCDNIAHQRSMVGFLANAIKSISLRILRQRAANSMIRTESRP
ncbi:hypothetical protein D3C79_370750 [compost metagenome]